MLMEIGQVTSLFKESRWESLSVSCIVDGLYVDKIEDLRNNNLLFQAT